MPNTNPSSNYGPPNFIVDPTPGKGSHTTISAAMNAASSPANIYIRPGTYTENITGKDGVNLVAYTGDDNNSAASSALVTINGTYSASFAGTASISGINFTTNSATNISITGSNISTITLQDCSFITSNAYSITHDGSGTRLIMRDCFSDFTTNSSSAGFLIQSTGLRSEIYNHNSKNTALNSTGGIYHADGTIILTYCFMSCGYYGTGSTASCSFFSCYFNTAPQITASVTQQSTGPFSTFSYCHFNSGDASAVILGENTVLGLFKCIVSSVFIAPINQSGTSSITYDDITFIGNSVINISNQIRLKQSIHNLLGITFDGVNILQNYSQGTFVPVAYGLTTSGSGTYTAQDGRYTRIGNRVCIQVNISWTAHTGTGLLGISGLPFTSANNPGLNVYTSGYLYNSTTNLSVDALYQVQPNQTSVFVVLPGTGANPYVSVGATQEHQFTLWYEV